MVACQMFSSCFGRVCSLLFLISPIMIKTNIFIYSKLVLNYFIFIHFIDETNITFFTEKKV